MTTNGTVFSGWLDQPVTIAFQVSHENKKPGGRVFLLFALEFLDDTEHETNDVLGEDDDKTFKSSPRLL